MNRPWTSVFLTVVFLSSVHAQAQIKDSSTLSPEQARDRLQQTTLFAFGGIGRAGTTSEGESCFRVITASTNALGYFTALVTNGTPEAKLYALCGIRKLAPKSFGSNAIPIIQANEKVREMFGCLMESDTTSNIVIQIKEGRYDFWLKPAKARQ